MPAPKKLHPIASFFLYGGLFLIVASFVGVSGVANVSVWWNSAEGWAQYVFTTIGIGAEGWGALGLLLLTIRYAQRQWLKAFICFALWVPAVGFNGYSTYRFFVGAGSEVQQTGEVGKTELQLANDRIAEITGELEVIGVTRTSEAITAERDKLPENYRTKRAELGAELATAERRETLEAELEEKRAAVLANAGADIAEDGSISNKEILIALVIWMEAIKALALWVMFGRPGRAGEASRGVVEDFQSEPGNLAPGAPVDDHRYVIEGPDGEERQIRVI